MKKTTLTGFSNYEIVKNGDKVVVNDTRTGKKVSVKKGMVSLECTEDVPNPENEAEPTFKSGNKYDFSVSEQLAKLGEEYWQDVAPETPASDGQGEAPKEGKPLTEEEIKKNEVKAEIKRLQGVVKECTDKLVSPETNTAELIMAAKAELEAAQKALDEYKAANKPERAAKEEKEPSPELLAAQSDYAAIDAEYQEAVKAAETLKEARKQAADAVRANGGKIKQDEVPTRAPHMDYETAQAIRKDYAIGRFGNEGEAMSVADIAKKHGCSTAAVDFKVNYLQHKLRKGDTPYTPLINEYYPEKWISKDGVERSGAPYAEDNVKEDASRYIKPENRAKKAAEAAQA